MSAKPFFLLGRFAHFWANELRLAPSGASVATASRWPQAIFCANQDVYPRLRFGNKNPGLRLETWIPVSYLETRIFFGSWKRGSPFAIWKQETWLAIWKLRFFRFFNLRNPLCGITFSFAQTNTNRVLSFIIIYFVVSGLFAPRPRN